MLKKIISQWHEIDKFISFYPGTGYRGLPSPEQAEQIKNSLGGKYAIFIHRDRDSLTDSEVETIKQEYLNKGIYIWFPLFSDIEAYFCKEDFLTDFLLCSEAEAQGYIENVLNSRSTDIRSQFNGQRSSHNSELYTTGGSPTNDDVWQSFQSRFLKGAKGKFVFKQLKNCIPSNKFNEEKISQHSLSGQIAIDLKDELKRLLEAYASVA